MHVPCLCAYGGRVTCNDVTARPTPTPIPTARRVSAHRARLRAQGLKPKTFWLPDVHSEAFRIAARKEALAIANSPTTREDLAFIEAAIDWSMFD